MEQAVIKEKDQEAAKLVSDDRRPILDAGGILLGLMDFGQKRVRAFRLGSRFCLFFISTCGLLSEEISASEAAKKWGASERRVQKPCGENQIPGAARFSDLRLSSKGPEKPADVKFQNTKKPS